MSRVEFNQCDNCEERIAEGEAKFIVAIKPAAGTEEPRVRLSFFDSMMGTPPPKIDSREFCSPRCVVAFFIASGAISNEVRW